MLFVKEKLEGEPTARKRYNDLLNRVDKFVATVSDLKDELAHAEDSLEADVKQLNQLDQQVLGLTLTIEKYMRIIREQSSLFHTCHPSSDIDETF